MSGIVDQLRRAADLITQPYLLEVLAAAGTGGRPSDAVPNDADPALVNAAVQRLIDIGAVDADSGEGEGVSLALTDRGEELLRLVHELDASRPDREQSEP